jgi:gliding motility-associated-like protein
MSLRPLLVLLTFFAFSNIRSQVCTTPGQTPVSPLTVCGSATYAMGSAIPCGQSTIPGPCTDGFPYFDKNPHFFRMACYSSGTLGFEIIPGDPSANFDWQVFDITGRNPVDIFTDPSLFVACNWSGDAGETGASSLGVSVMVCSGSQPLFSMMPNVIAGRTYLLMVVNQNQAPGGYQLAFGGGTASITDLVDPRMFNAGVNCNGTRIGIRMNKPMTCNSLAADGTDFRISGGVGIVSAYPGPCLPNIGSDSVYLVLDRVLTPGPYTITIQNGSDGNTMIDKCDRSIADGESVSFTWNGLAPTLMDNITAPGCTFNYIDLVFRKLINCNSISASDFIITGPQAVTPVIIPTQGCITGAGTLIIRIGFSPASIIPGTYQVELVRGTDGNTLIDNCGLETPAGAKLSFEMSEPVSAQFTYTIPPACRESNVAFSNVGTNVANWSWTFDNSITSSLQNPVILFSTPGSHKAELIVSNTKCRDTSEVDFITPDFMTADFNVPAMICAGDTVQLENTSGNAPDSWLWDFGNGVTSTMKDPQGFRYSIIGRDMYYTISLTATNIAAGCSFTVKRVVKVLTHCTIGVPSAFTPNGDGKNDYLYPLNALKADQLDFRVYNRMGQLVFQTRDWMQKWDGSINGNPQGTGVYAWFLSFVHQDTKEKVFMKGTTLLLR